MKKWTEVSNHNEAEKIKKIKASNKLTKHIPNELKTFFKTAPIALLALAGMSEKSEAKGKGPVGGELLAYVKTNCPTVNYQDVQESILDISYEEAARDRMAYVFNAVVDSMNNKAQQALTVWKNPPLKRKLVSGVFQRVTGRSTYSASCIATCSYSVLTAFDALNDTINVLPENNMTYGTSFLKDPAVQKNTLTVSPGAKAIENAIIQNNIQPGDFVLIPRGVTKSRKVKGRIIRGGEVLYHTVMYVGKNEKGEPVYSANNNPAVKKEFDYYNRQAMRFNKPIKIVRVTKMYEEKCVEAMNNLERRGIPREDILFYTYSSMGDSAAFIELVSKNRKYKQFNELENLTPFAQNMESELDKAGKEHMDKLFSAVIKPDIEKELSKTSPETKMVASIVRNKSYCNG